MTRQKSSSAETALSRTPPDKSILPPTPPGSNERPASRLAATARDLERQYRKINTADLSETHQLNIHEDFDPHKHLDVIHTYARRFDCYRKYIRLRMPSTFHEFVITGLAMESHDRLRKLGGKFEQVFLGGSSRVYLDGKLESRQPDIQFRTRSRRFPGVIIEVAHTQTHKALEALAYDYILKSDGLIKRVYGIDINPKGRPSTVSEWRVKTTPSDDPDYDEEVRVEKGLYKEFCAADGSLANPDESLVISLNDFDIDTAEQDREIAMSFSTIYKCYETALQFQAQDEIDTEPRRKRVKRVHPTPSPIEQLKSDDEKRFQAAEQRAQGGAPSDYEPTTEEDDSSS
ncbi:hypothetical protein LLEC1_03509 [Akanthomyces lecanii]|uniref:Restriction endonuclease domain-containing protein n=1 Tax=Cordyceps confragosa TaxID=2714763 RepID=A0A179I326_CORDF|nr:hypothetical protein LLEC1_03509 [Akanthomyces lecanii]